MSLFWNDTPRKDHGRFLPLSSKKPTEALIVFDEKWDAVQTLTDADLLKMNAEDVASFSGETPEFLNSVIEQALFDWRINPGSSFLNIVSQADRAKNGSQMFGNLSLQTRVLGGLLNTDIQIPWKRTLEAICTDTTPRKIFTAAGKTALTASEKGTEKLNDLARAMRVWEMRNAAFVRDGRVKLPKKLYRGIRQKDIELKMESISREDDENFHRYSAKHTQRHYDALLAATVEEAMPGVVLSFSSNENVAKYFANDEGYILEINPASVSIVTSYLLNEELDTTDQVSKRHEREWIVRLPRDMTFSTENVRIWDADWLMYHGDHQGISMVGHSTYATYEMNERKIKAHFEYNGNGVGGKIYFRVDDNYSMTHADAKRHLGFSPIPSSQDEIKNLEFWNYDRYDYGRKAKVTLLNEPEIGHVNVAKMGP